MSKQDDGGAAFARPRSADPDHYHNAETYHAQEGMSLRDYFAAKAMQGFLSNAHLAKKEPMNRVQMSVAAYELADAMLVERAK